jgi:hypothetical protein
MRETTLYDLTKSLRSKNASVDQITFDIIFQDEDVYDYIKEHRLFTKEDVAELYDISIDEIAVFVYFDPAKAIKFTLDRPRPSGDPGETDVYGSQQYGPLFDVELSIPEEILAD